MGRQPGHRMAAFLYSRGKTSRRRPDNYIVSEGVALGADEPPKLIPDGFDSLHPCEGQYRPSRTKRQPSGW